MGGKNQVERGQQGDRGKADVPGKAEAGQPDGSPWEVPTNPALLHAWLREHLGLSVPRTPIVEGHAAPFAYLEHTFFEGRGCFEPRGGGSSANLCAGGVAETAVPPVALDCVVWANRGGGKTFLGAVATLLDLVFKPGIEVRILGGSMEQSKRMHAHLRRLFDPRQRPALAALVDGRITDTRLRLKNGSVVELLAQSQTSVRGTRVQKLRCDEVDLFSRDVWEAAQLTTRSVRCGAWDVVGSVECLSTMHITHGVMHDLLEECRAGVRTLLRWGVVDTLEHCGDEHHCEPRAPAGGSPCVLLQECGGLAKKRPALDAGHITVSDAITLKRRVSRATWDAEMLCKRPRRTDAVLPEFDHARHVVDAIPFDAHSGDDAPPLLWLAGMDFGWRAPTVVVWGVLDASDRLFIVDERCERGLMLEDHIAAIKRGLRRDEKDDAHARAVEPEHDPRPAEGWPAVAWIGVDPAGENAHEQTGTSNVDAMRSAGLTVKARRLPVREGLDLIRARLAPADASPPRLLIHARCVTLIESLERYHFPADDPDSDKPVKRDGFDHAVDALRYLMQNLDRPYKTVVKRYL